MATYRITKEDGDYTTVVVEFADKAFQQTVLLTEDADLQAYADQYEADWLALQEPA